VIDAAERCVVHDLRAHCFSPARPTSRTERDARVNDVRSAGTTRISRADRRPEGARGLGFFAGASGSQTFSTPVKHQPVRDPIEMFDITFYNLNVNKMFIDTMTAWLFCSRPNVNSYTDTRSIMMSIDLV
jgi:hypothetical protein